MLLNSFIFCIQPSPASLPSIWQPSVVQPSMNLFLSCFFLLEAGGWQRCAVASTHPGQERLHLSLSVLPTPRSSASPRGQLGAIALAYLLLLKHLLLPAQHLTSITRELILSPLPIYASQPQHTFFFPKALGRGWD